MENTQLDTTGIPTLRISRVTARVSPGRRSITRRSSISPAVRLLPITECIPAISVPTAPACPLTPILPVQETVPMAAIETPLPLSLREWVEAPTTPMPPSQELQTLLPIIAQAAAATTTSSITIDIPRPIPFRVPRPTSSVAQGQSAFMYIPGTLKRRTELGFSDALIGCGTLLLIGLCALALLYYLTM